MKIDVWADVMCPWCYIGKRRLAAAIAQFEHEDSVEVLWRSFELRTDQSSEPAATLADIMHQHRDMDTTLIATIFDRIRQTASMEGLDLNLDHVRPVRSFDAHRVIHLASTSGLGDQMIERLFRAHLTENQNVANHDVLVNAAEEAGLVASDVRATLARGAYASQVRSDEAQAAALGISTVPTFLIDNRYRLSGSPPVDSLLGLFREASTAAGSC